MNFGFIKLGKLYCRLKRHIHQDKVRTENRSKIKIMAIIGY